MRLIEVNTRYEVSDDSVEWRLCLKCGVFYYGKHSKCPHGDRTTSLLETV